MSAVSCHTATSLNLPKSRQCHGTAGEALEQLSRSDFLLKTPCAPLCLGQIPFFIVWIISAATDRKRTIFQEIFGGRRPSTRCAGPKDLYIREATDHRF